LFAVVGIIGLLGIILGMMFGIPQYRVWQREKAGIAELRQAEWNRQIRIKEAQAEQEAAKALAQAEIERARGVAEANRIIGESLAGNEAYLRYLWVQGLNNENSKVIYVPTEAQLPLLEAGRAVR
jgi:regulator of protease activity HflC (stomatin/prohibitin superfamily)